MRLEIEETLVALFDRQIDQWVDLMNRRLLAA
jgi:hypothetical protein